MGGDIPSVLGAMVWFGPGFRCKPEKLVDVIYTELRVEERADNDSG